MKKTNILFVLILAILALPACDRYYNQRPPDYPNTKWVSTDPDIYFVVKDSAPYHNEGELKMADGEIIRISLIFDYGSGVSFIDLDTAGQEGNIITGYLLTGDCKFSETKLIVNIRKSDTNTVFDPSLKQIVFAREDLASLPKLS